MTSYEPHADDLTQNYELDSLDLPIVVENFQKKHIRFSRTKNPLKKARLRISKLHREVQPCNW